MQIAKLSLENKEAGKVQLPVQFSEPIRADLIHRVVISQQANARQPYGADPRAGKKHSHDLSRRRRQYRGSYGFGISRVPRKIHSKNGTRFGWVGDFAPMTVGGRRAHPPKVEKIWARKVNVQERRKAIRSALAATLSKDLVSAHGHRLPATHPFAVESKIEDLKNTKEAAKVLQKLGFAEELSRTAEKQARAGKGKMRGRKFRTKTGPLLVVSQECALLKAARNIPGVDVCVADQLNAELLAPGAVPGRLVLFSEAALERLGKEELFVHSRVVEKKEKPAKEKKGYKGKKKAAKPAKKSAPKKSPEKKNGGEEIMEPHAVLRYPLSTEKAVRAMQSENKLLFVVHHKANKVDIRNAVEKIFKVKVKKVNTLLDKEGKKRAFVQLSPDHPAIDITTKLGLM